MIVAAAGYLPPVAGAVFLPHLAWLVQHDFVTLRYASLRVQGESGLLDHRLSDILRRMPEGTDVETLLGAMLTAQLDRAS